ncbi:EG45-like domain containing protein [Phalaenopsis equestris]|uniref:EG45-like domain containing protein n=1 Tax=Phalaenopsis equestris TaxID=78828 RepID=UPI0009E48428|nr:EG45-like domain containing protein [Phalaenopsis equestris]
MSSYHLLFPLILAIFAVNSTANQGTATYYAPPYTPSACYGNQNEGVMIAGASDVFWDDRGACGSSYKVRCIGAANDVPNPCSGAEVVVKIVDYCPPPFCNGTINLSQDAFRAIALLKAGKIMVSYDRA